MLLTRPMDSAVDNNSDWLTQKASVDASLSCLVFVATVKKLAKNSWFGLPVYVNRAGKLKSCRPCQFWHSVSIEILKRCSKFVHSYFRCLFDQLSSIVVYNVIG